VSPKTNRFVDANVIIRFVTNDDPIKARRSAALFGAVSDGTQTIILSEIVIADLVWTLYSFYKWSKEKIRDFVSALLVKPAVQIDNKSRLLEALTLFARENIDFSDALIAVYMQHHRIGELYSYDRDFDRIDGIVRVEP
jgi:uncharacterized protein